MEKTLRNCVAYIDGGSRGNPGTAGYGVYVVDPEGKQLARLSAGLGIKTNNFAEYSALIAALQFAAANQYGGIKIFADSELLVKQINGVYRVKNPDLRKLYDQAQLLISNLESFSIQHIPREQNREADSLANLAMDEMSSNEGIRIQPRASTPKILAVFQNGYFKPLVALNLPENGRFYLRFDPADNVSDQSDLKKRVG
jgi:probable phosphoglycerate mutase